MPQPQGLRDPRSPGSLGRLHHLNFETPSTVLVACLILGYRAGGKKRGKEGGFLGAEPDALLEREGRMGQWMVCASGDGAVTGSGCREQMGFLPWYLLEVAALPGLFFGQEDHRLDSCLWWAT